MDFRFWMAILGALPELIALFRRIADRAQSAADRRLGYNEAVKDATREAAEGLVAAMDAFNEARAKHKVDPTDGAFDQTFMRPD